MASVRRGEIAGKKLPRPTVDIVVEMAIGPRMAARRPRLGYGFDHQ